MSIIITILTALVALEFVYIFTPNDFRSYKPRLQYEC